MLEKTPQTETSPRQFIQPDPELLCIHPV